LGVEIFLLDEALFLVIVFTIASNNNEVSSQPKLMLFLSPCFPKSMRCKKPYLAR
jgi:hypothetical protein